MSNVSVDYGKILQMVTSQLLSVKNGSEAYSGISLFVENERQFTRMKSISPNSVHAVVKYGNSAVNFGQSVIPAWIEVVSEKNSIEAAQSLFSEYVVAFNLKRSGNILQVYQTPRVSSSFNEIGNGFRATLEIEAVFVTSGEDGDGLESLEYSYVDPKYGKETESVPILSFSDGLTVDLRPQPIPDERGFAKSVAGFSSYTFSITTYLTKSRLCSDLNEAKYSGDLENKSYEFSLSFSSGRKFSNRAFKLSRTTMKQDIGENATISATFSL